MSQGERGQLCLYQPPVPKAVSQQLQREYCQWELTQRAGGSSVRTLVGIKNIWFQLVRVEEKILFSGGLQEQIILK